MRLQRIEASPHNHAVRDKRKPTAYRVLDNQGRVLGTVFTISRESWATNGRIRTRFLGYARDWVAMDAQQNRVGYYHYSREAAVKALRERAAAAALAE